MKINLVLIIIIVFCLYSFSQSEIKVLNPITYIGGVSNGEIRKELLIAQAGITCKNDSIRSDIRFKVTEFSMKTSLSNLEIKSTNGARITKEMTDELQRLRYNDTVWFFNILAKGYGYDSMQVGPIELIIKRITYNESIIDLFMSLPIEYTPELYSTGKDSLIQFGYYKFPKSDSLEIRKINGNDFSFNLSYYNKYKPPKGTCWPSSNGGHYDGWIIAPHIFLQLKEFNNYNNVIVNYGYSNDKKIKVLYYKDGVLSESNIQLPDTPMVSSFLQENIPDSIYNLFNSKAKVYIDLMNNKKDQFAFSIESILTLENSQWIKTDRIYFRWENESFVRIRE